MKKTIIATFALIAATLASQAQVQLLTGPIINPENGHYYYMTTVASWTSAESFAESLGCHLATIRNAQEDSWVYNTFTGMDGAQNLWVGLNDLQHKGTYSWADGEPITYLNWGPGEPDDSGGIEDCVRYFEPSSPKAGTWNDAPNNANCEGIIESLQPVPEPSVLALGALAAAVAGPAIRRRNLR
jgi:hypothetical protein